MKKLEVTTGVYWLEIPEAQLAILCGCPADVVKHLMKRGLILNREEDGVVFETGPNAILLSDVSIDNSNFTNLAEFPVLQMFYRQGMILPNHPGNTGIKPLLIGHRDQVAAQSEYIYRGNYGLVSEEEIVKTGIDEETAHEMMRLKMRFAFDRILPTEELLDTRVVGSETVEIRDGVTIRRSAFNEFEIAYNGETVTVNLNLEPGESYRPAFHLGAYRVEREYFGVVHIGEGDGWDSERPCMASLITFQGKIYLIDAGPNIQHSLTALGINVNDIEGVFHTHVHDDHFSGLTTLIRSDHRIKYFATKLVRESCMKKMAALMSMDENSLAAYFDIHDLKFDIWNNIDGLEVKPIFSPHPVETNIYFFRTLWQGGYKTYAHFADIVSRDVLEKMVTDDETKSGVSRAFFTDIMEKYAQRADLKKIDIGGGLIHGNASDFADDPSPRLILSHTSRPLNVEEKEIGSNANFGTQDTLIQAFQDYSFRSAHEYFTSYFPDVPAHELSMVLNSPIESFNVGAIVIRRGEVPQSIYLVLQGVMEYIERGKQRILSTGSFAGELSGLKGEASPGTFRAASHVQAMVIPSEFFRTFTQRNELYDKILRLYDRRMFLLNTWLFGDMTSYPVHTRLAETMDPVRYRTGQTLPMDNQRELYLQEAGRMEIRTNSKCVETVESGGFFGEESILYHRPKHFHARILEDSEGYLLSHDVLKDIPIVRWKLFETYQRRLKCLEN